MLINLFLNIKDLFADILHFIFRRVEKVEINSTLSFYCLMKDAVIVTDDNKIIKLNGDELIIRELDDKGLTQSTMAMKLEEFSFKLILEYMHCSDFAYISGKIVTNDGCYSLSFIDADYLSNRICLTPPELIRHNLQILLIESKMSDENEDNEIERQQIACAYQIDLSKEEELKKNASKFYYAERISKYYFVLFVTTRENEKLRVTIPFIERGSLKIGLTEIVTSAREEDFRNKTSKYVDVIEYITNNRENILDRLIAVRMQPLKIDGYVFNIDRRSVPVMFESKIIKN